MNHVLIVDDDQLFRDTLVKTLKSLNYRTTGIAEPGTIASAIAVHRPDVVLLDMMFATGESGLEVCRQLRTWCSIPIIILSVLDDESIKVQVLDAGADDYLTKPFGVHELLARIRAVERRLAQNAANTKTPYVSIGNLRIDFDTRQAKLDDRVVRLTRKEFVLIKTLADAQGKLVTYEKLLASIWKEDSIVDRSRLRALVMQLRHKLEEDLNNPQYIITEPGVGYRVNLDPSI